MNSRLSRFSTGFLLTAALGCGSSQPAPAPVPAVPPPSVAGTQPAGEPASTAPRNEAVAPSPVIGGPGIAKVEASLRDLAGRYIESDGAGGLRPNEKAALELEKLGPDATDALWPLLSDKQVEVRRGAAYYLLGNFNPNSAEQVKAFSALLDDADQSIRGFGLTAARQMREEDQAAAVPRLAAMLDPDHEARPQNRESVARLLGGLKANATGALEKLTASATSDPASGVRSSSLVAIAQIADKEAASLVAKGLADKESVVRLVAAVRLRQFGAASAPASKELAAALADGDSRVRAATAEALVKVGKPAVAEIAAQLTTDSLDARKLALYCLTKIGPDAKEAAPLVEKCLVDSDAEVQKLAAAALASINAKP